MPKRSNSFQQVIHFIHSQLELEGTTVTESALLLEINVRNPIEREVDILIEKELGDTKLKLAVECRGRARKDSVEWIDGLIGKYLYLPVNGVIAVSESGFTKKAILIAKRQNIELIALQQAFEKDWPREFQKLSIAKIKGHLEPCGINYEIEPPLKNKLRRKDTIYKRTGEENCISAEDYINKYSLPTAKKSLNKYLKDHFLEIYKTRADFDKLTLLEIPVSCEDMFLLDSNGEEHDLKVITFYWKLNWKITKSNVKHKLFKEKALITTGIVEIKDTSKIVRIVQIKDKGTGTLFTEEL